jgi:DNA invertase Pin-like site-specific DNA recombinase
MSATPTAYSYIRFSHPSQAEGDSLRRQTEAAAAWCERNGVALDTSLTLHDKGVSGYTGKHRENPDRHALALFLRAVEKERVARGSYLLIENLDRLSREDEVPATNLLTNILMAGVNVVQLAPYEMLLTEKSNGWELMRAVMELSRGHGESAIKSERVGKAWANKRKAARENGKPLTLRLPGWVEERDGGLFLVPERAAVVRLIFRLAADGYGLTSIVRKLVEDGVAPFGDGAVRPGKKRGAFCGKWSRSYVGLLLKDRRAIGAYQPCRRDGTPEGDPITGYYPAAVTEEEFHAARSGAAERQCKPGRIGKHVNVFAGLLRNARDGDTYYTVTRVDRKIPARVLVNNAGFQGRSACWSFPLDTFERAVLKLLREVDPREVVGRADGPDELLALGGERSQLESDIKAIEADLNAHGESPTLYRRLREKEARLGEVVRLIDAARQKAASPLSEAWGELGTLADALDAAPDPEDARLRLRSALRRVVESIWLLIVPRGRDRLAAVQVHFAGDGCRNYLVLNRPPKSNGKARVEGGWWARSLADIAALGPLDLRKQIHVKALEAELLALDLNRLTE